MIHGLLCHRLNWPNYRSCPSVCPSIQVSNWKTKRHRQTKFRINVPQGMKVKVKVVNLYSASSRTEPAAAQPPCAACRHRLAQPPNRQPQSAVLSSPPSVTHISGLLLT